MNYVHPEYLITPAELSAIVDDENLRIIDATVFLERGNNRMTAASGLERFDAAHIAGAQFLDLVEAASDTTTGLGFSLPEPGKLEAVFRELGIDANSRVVIYSTGHMMWATRAWWLLYYLGHDNIAVLDGGFEAWQASGLPVTTEAARRSPGSFAATPRPEVFANRDLVSAAIGDESVTTVNALTAELHSGDAEFHYGRKGHIAGSCNLPYDALLEAGRFRSADEIKDALAAKNMLEVPKVITYCGGGIAATVDAFACLLVGQDAVAVYDGSMSEWVSDPNAPMATGPDPD